jgi:hypothetical protein
MEEIEEIFENVILILQTYDNIRTYKDKKKVTITHGSYFKIVIQKGNQKTLSLFYRWNMGIIGKKIFRQKNENMIKITEDIKKVIHNSGFKVSQLTQNI